MPNDCTGHTAYGPGLKKLSERTWYGPGYCGICGDTGEDLVPVMVRWWDCDDGYRTGVLCRYCGAEQTHRTPRPSDFAYEPGLEDFAQLLDLAVEMSAGDEDAAHCMIEDFSI